MLSYPFSIVPSTEIIAAAKAAAITLLLAEGLAVGALIHGGICLMGTNHNAVQRAVVLSIAVVCAGLDGTFDALVCMAVHIHFLLHFGFGNSMAGLQKIIRCFFCLFVVLY